MGARGGGEKVSRIGRGRAGEVGGGKGAFSPSCPPVSDQCSCK